MLSIPKSIHSVCVYIYTRRTHQHSCCEVLEEWFPCLVNLSTKGLGFIMVQLFWRDQAVLMCSLRFLFSSQFWEQNSHVIQVMNNIYNLYASENPVIAHAILNA